MTLLAPLSDVVVVVACIAAAIGCFVLNRRVRRLASTERGIGKAVSEMARSVGQFETLLTAAEASTREASAILDEQFAQARKLVARLELLTGAAARSAAAPQTLHKAPSPADPLAEVVPKGAALAAPSAPGAAAGATSNGTAQMRLADLAHRRATIADTAAGLGRSPRA
jgi:hypothetical protein